MAVKLGAVGDRKAASSMAAPFTGSITGSGRRKYDISQNSI